MAKSAPFFQCDFPPAGNGIADDHSLCALQFRHLHRHQTNRVQSADAAGIAQPQLRIKPFQIEL